jgi:23S rRNA U2552 (ribose-2'-O)-methylase RlmE/FtsJ
MTDSGDLHRIFLGNGGLVLHKWFHYFDIYERHFSRFRERPIRMLEIGVFGGGSLKMWQSYFHPESTIVGIDIRSKCKQYAGGNVHVMIGSQDDEAFLRRVVRKFGPFDIVLDDGSHQNPHVIKSFEVLYPELHETGVYMVEDAHTSYLEKFGGGLRREGTMIEMFKAKIDELNATFAKEQPVTDFTRTTDALCFYDSVIVVEKRPQGKRQTVMTHGMGVSRPD